MINSENTTFEIKKILSDILGLDKQTTQSIEIDTVLLGNIPELDSVAVVAIIIAIEKKFAITIKDDEISARTFETLGSLVNFVTQKTHEKQN